MSILGLRAVWVSRFGLAHASKEREMEVLSDGHGKRYAVVFPDIRLYMGVDLHETREASVAAAQAKHDATMAFHRNVWAGSKIRCVCGLYGYFREEGCERPMCRWGPNAIEPESERCKQAR